MDSCNAKFLEDGFRSVGEIKQDLVLYELQEDDPLSLGEGENLNIPVSPRIVLTHCMEEIMRFWLPRRITLGKRFIPSLQFLNMRLLHLFRIPLLLRIGGVILYQLKILHLLEI